MCIAIYNSPKGGTIKRSILKNCWDNNGHGAGLLRPDNHGGLWVYKELQSFDRFYEVYAQQRELYPKLKFAIHFRIKTHGKINLENCHPFLVNKKVGFIHNGILSGYPTTTNESDTFLFNENILKGLSPMAIERPDCQKLLEVIIGKYNKMVFITANNERFILNKEAGIWFEDNWYSNSSFRNPVLPIKAPEKKSYWENKYRKTKTAASRVNQSKFLFDKSYEEGELSEELSSDLCTECLARPIESQLEKRYNLCVKCLERFDIFTNEQVL